MIGLEFGLEVCSLIWYTLDRLHCIVITILGTKSTKSKNQIIWVDKSPMCYSNWNRGEPNGDGWIGIEMTKWGGWNDIPIFTRRTFMCQTKG